jgi:purine-binding chemotaxis protein CheW
VRQVLGFVVGGVGYALPLEAVERVVRAVEITPLPEAPQAILGVINARGRVVAVADLRRRFGLPEKALGVDDKMIIAQTARRPLAVVADDVHGLVECSDADLLPAEQIDSRLRHVEAIARTGDGLLLIQDLDCFLGLDEEASLQHAMRHG